MKENEMGIACGIHGEKTSAYGVFVGKPEGKRPLGGHKRRREDNIKVDLREM
jgi:hypothetical protein